MPNKNLPKSCKSLLLAVGFVLSAAPAYAGFQWVPAEGATYQQPAAPAPYVAAPVATAPASRAPEVISPVVISGDVSPSVAAPAQALVAPAAPAQALVAPAAATSAPTTLTLSTNAPAAQAPTTLTPPPAKAEKLDLATATISVAPSAAADAGSDVVRGFASHVPLALALRQILPVGYNFSIDQGVDMDTQVSYRGGKSWRETLKDMLAPAGLAAQEQGTAVTVSRVGGPVAAPAPVAEKSLPSLQPPKNVGSSMNYLVAPANETPAMNVSVAEGWSADRGDTLHKVLSAWCQRAGIELQWHTEYDYPIEASAHFSSGFEDAVRNLLAGFDAARPQPIGELHTNSGAGQMVLVVQARGNSYTN